MARTNLTGAIYGSSWKAVMGENTECWRQRGGDKTGHETRLHQTCKEGRATMELDNQQRNQAVGGPGAGPPNREGAVKAGTPSCSFWVQNVSYSSYRVRSQFQLHLPLWPPGRRGCALPLVGKGGSAGGIETDQPSDQGSWQSRSPASLGTMEVRAQHVPTFTLKYYETLRTLD